MTKIPTPLPEPYPDRAPYQRLDSCGCYEEGYAKDKITVTRLCKMHREMERPEDRILRSLLSGQNPIHSNPELFK